MRLMNGRCLITRNWQKCARENVKILDLPCRRASAQSVWTAVRAFGNKGRAGKCSVKALSEAAEAAERMLTSSWLCRNEPSSKCLSSSVLFHYIRYSKGQTHE